MNRLVPESFEVFGRAIFSRVVNLAFRTMGRFVSRMADGFLVTARSGTPAAN